MKTINVKDLVTMLLPDRNMYQRIYNFVKAVQVHDRMGCEEREDILNYCIKNYRHTNED